MGNQQKIESNRRNARKRRRPRTANSRSRLNARKHGLSTPIMADPKMRAEAWNLARTIVGEGADNERLKQALIIAETELELQRVQEARRAAIESELRREEAKGWADGASRYSPEEQFYARAVALAAPLLSQIERYERRIYGRRAKAMLYLNGLKWLARCSVNS